MPVFLVTVPADQVDVVCGRLRGYFGRDLRDVHVGGYEESRNGYAHKHIVVKVSKDFDSSSLADLLRISVNQIQRQNHHQNDTNAWFRFKWYADKGFHQETSYSKRKRNQEERISDADLIKAVEGMSPGTTDVAVLRRFPFLLSNPLKLRMLMRFIPPPVKSNDRRCCMWLYSESGNGKTTMVHELLHKLKLPFYTLPLSKEYKWWDGYDKQPVVIMNEFTPDNYLPSGPFKDLVDVNPVRVEVKGGVIQVRPKLIIITSNFQPRDIYGHLPEQDRTAVYSRILCKYIPHHIKCKTQYEDIKTKICEEMVRLTGAGEEVEMEPADIFNNPTQPEEPGPSKKWRPETQNQEEYLQAQEVLGESDAESEPYDEEDPLAFLLSMMDDGPIAYHASLI